MKICKEPVQYELNFCRNDRDKYSAFDIATWGLDSPIYWRDYESRLFLIENMCSSHAANIVQYYTSNPNFVNDIRKRTFKHFINAALARPLILWDEAQERLLSCNPELAEKFLHLADKTNSVNRAYAVVAISTIVERLSPINILMLDRRFHNVYNHYYSQLRVAFWSSEDAF